MQHRVILLVEDNPDDQELTVRALKKSNIAHEVVLARDGVQALDYLFGRGAFAGRDITVMPQVVLLDLKLSKIDCLGVLREIRHDDRTRFLPVVVLTSSNEERDRIQPERASPSPRHKVDAGPYCARASLPRVAFLCGSRPLSKPVESSLLI